MEAVLSSSTTDVNNYNINGNYMFAIVQNDYVIGWAFSDDKKNLEVEKDNIIAVKMTLENTPAFGGGYYDGKKFYPPIKE